MPSAVWLTMSASPGCTVSSELSLASNGNSALYLLYEVIAAALALDCAYAKPALFLQNKRLRPHA